jgi:hypothetical protein
MLFSQQAVYMYIRRIVVSSMLTEAWVYTLEIRSLGVCLKDIATITYGSTIYCSLHPQM